ncbi:phosphopantothenoylcysteine decarboxylase [Pilibacter termitis]|uniref:Phosphopantothenoylcysteine decarboxylase n=1 Tax=Pilibacter termitis TaxID=263852 RepID=A0A1T4MX80_9ENTE|nr:flavoprotein [Pilibacter termitis]SJZ71387.1 phosphopantothenoylcysteine decarboxylase [Pilibacter termitis]
MKKMITLGISASSAVWKMCDLIERFRKNEQFEIDVHVIMTENATKFISPLMFQTLTQNEVSVNVAQEHEPEKINHIFLAQSSDVFLIAPATSNTIGKIAHGMADNMLTSVAQAVPKGTPKLFAPAMNDVMYHQEIVQENIDKLKKRGYKEIKPREDRLSSGKIAIGALAEVEAIEKEVLDFLLM